MDRKVLIVLFLTVVFGGIYVFKSLYFSQGSQGILTDFPDPEGSENLVSESHRLSIEFLRKGKYPGSSLVIEKTLTAGANYQRFIASYVSEGLKIYGLLTVPDENLPSGGFPVIVFNHGYIPPGEYQSTERYVAYVDGFARSGYVVFRPDYRGHGDSDGVALGAYGSPDYSIDVLNALESIKKYKEVNPEKIGMWGHSLGGYITLRNMVVSKDIKAGVIWAGVVGSYPDLLTNWRRSNSPFPLPTGARRWRQSLVDEFGSPEANPEFWSSVSANSYLKDISGPLQLHHGTADVSVPVQFSEKLFDQMMKIEKEVEIYKYPGDDHNISRNFGLAMNRSIEFFDKYLK